MIVVKAMLSQLCTLRPPANFLGVPDRHELLVLKFPENFDCERLYLVLTFVCGNCRVRVSLGLKPLVMESEREQRQKEALAREAKRAEEEKEAKAAELAERIKAYAPHLLLSFCIRGIHNCRAYNPSGK